MSARASQGRAPRGALRETEKGKRSRERGWGVVHRPDSIGGIEEMDTDTACAGRGKALGRHRDNSFALFLGTWCGADLPGANAVDYRDS